MSQKTQEAEIARITVNEWDRAIQGNASPEVLAEIGNALRNFTVGVARLKGE